MGLEPTYKWGHHIAGGKTGQKLQDGDGAKTYWVLPGNQWERISEVTCATVNTWYMWYGHPSQNSIVYPGFSKIPMNGLITIPQYHPTVGRGT